MTNLILYNPSIGTSNVGDKIIFKYIYQWIKDIFPENGLVELPTQMPVSSKLLKRFKDTEHRFVCGSNLLQSNMFFSLCRYGITTHGIRQWDVSLLNAKKVGPTILIGCGWQNYNKKMNLYTKLFWKKILSDTYIHSVRDSYTQERLASIGVKNVLNTGCPTTWRLTPQFCEQIPRGKAPNVITTLTDYRPSIRDDEKMLQTLLNNYEKVWLWLQGLEDKKYLMQIKEDIRQRLHLIPPQLESYESFLTNNDVDYVGTRLHGGIHALNYKKRTIIIGVDNRAIEMKRDINLKVISRNEMDILDTEINDNWKTEIILPQKNIDRFSQQFCNE